MEFAIPEDANPERADRILASHLPPGLSRSSVAKLIRSGSILVSGHPIKPSTILKPGDSVEIICAEPRSSLTQQETELPEFHILFEDPHLLVLDKPPGIVVHPGAGRPSGTLVDAVVCIRPEIVGVGEPGRWGVVHRLDRDTSGVMVLAKTLLVYESLCLQFREHSIQRMYMALVRGNPGQDRGIVDAPLGRHAKDRKRISTSTVKARRAVTRWTVSRRFRIVTLLEVRPETGRTHQIRVHLASVGLPVLGDPVYGRIHKQQRSIDQTLKKCVAIMKRQALHAATLGFQHPVTGQYVNFCSPIPSDMAEVIRVAGTFNAESAHPTSLNTCVDAEKKETKKENIIL